MVCDHNPSFGGDESEVICNYVFDVMVCYHGDVWLRLGCFLFHVLGNKVALILHHVQCQSVSGLSLLNHPPTVYARDLCTGRGREGIG